MAKLYNSQTNIASDLFNFFKNLIPTLSKPHLKLIPFIIIGMIQSESVVTTDIVKKLKGNFLYVNPFLLSEGLNVF